MSSQTGGCLDTVKGYVDPRQWNPQTIKQNALRTLVVSAVALTVLALSISSAGACTAFITALSVAGGVSLITLVYQFAKHCKEGRQPDQVDETPQSDPAAVSEE